METTESPSKSQSTAHALPSGATLHLGRPEYAAAARLRNALARALGGAPFSPAEMKTTLDGLTREPSAAGALLQRLLSVVASNDVEAALFDVLRAGIYQPKGSNNQLKVNVALLDDPTFGDEARVDLYPIFYRAAEVALRPFLAVPVSAYLARLKKSAPSPESKSE